MANSLKQVSLTCSGHTRPVVHLDFSDITECGTSFLISACKGFTSANEFIKNNCRALILEKGRFPCFFTFPLFQSTYSQTINIWNHNHFAKQNIVLPRWKGDTGDWVGTFEGHKGAVWGVALNRMATLAASGAADFSGKIWDAITGEEKCSFQHNHIVKSVAFSEQASLLVSGSNEKLLRVFDLNQPLTNTAIEIYAGHSGSIKRALFCRNDRCIVSCAEDKGIRIWDRSTGCEVQHIDFPINPSNIEISRDGTILTATSGCNVSFYEMDTLKKIKEIAVPTKLASASLHPEKLVFVAGGEDFKIYKFDYITGNEIESFKGHFGPVHTVKFSPDGELYASGSEDGTLRLWQTVVGKKSYGLWKYINGAEEMGNTSSVNNSSAMAV